MIPPSYSAITTGAETYIEYTTGEREYYDNRADPYQRTNIIASVTPARGDTLHATLAHSLVATVLSPAGKPCRNHDHEPCADEGAAS